MKKYKATAQITVGSEWYKPNSYRRRTVEPRFPEGGDFSRVYVEFESDGEYGSLIINDMCDAIIEKLGRSDWHLWYWRCNETI